MYKETKIKNKKIYIFNNDSLEKYKDWEPPVTIISDGPYGVEGYNGDLNNVKDLAKWYEPHVVEWSRYSTPKTTLWFWNTEKGLMNVNPVLEKHGWTLKSVNTWYKGKGHIAGNVNTKSITHFPIATEVCAQYIKEPIFFDEEENVISMKEWLRKEWKRTGMPLYLTNEACGLKNAASRKYFTLDHLWYMPPPDAFEKIVNYANKNGKDKGKPYFSIDGKNSLTQEEWENLKPIFNCPFGYDNVWSVPQLKGEERLKDSNGKVSHRNQKPLELIDLIVNASTEEGNVVWDPFGGLFTTAVSCLKNNRICYTSEINKDIYLIAKKRLLEYI